MIPRTQDERIDRLWQIINLLIAANFDLMESIANYDPAVRAELCEIAIYNRRAATKIRRMLEKEGIDVDRAIADMRVRFEANPLGFDIAGQEPLEPWVPLPPRRIVYE
jgi:hypothetical protein